MLLQQPHTLRGHVIAIQTYKEIQCNVITLLKETAAALLPSSIQDQQVFRASVELIFSAQNSPFNSGNTFSLRKDTGWEKGYERTDSLSFLILPTTRCMIFTVGNAYLGTLHHCCVSISTPRGNCIREKSPPLLSLIRQSRVADEESFSTAEPQVLNQPPCHASEHH